MLKPELAKSRLEGWQLPSERNRIEECARKLPTDLNEIALWAYGYKEDDTDSFLGGWEEARRRGREAVVQLDSLSVKKRAKVFEVVSPTLATAMERAWQLLKTTPYQAGYEKKAFRAPRHPEVLAERLYSWLVSMAAVAQHYPPELLTPTWLSAWAPHLFAGYRSFGEEIGTLLAAVLHETGAESDEVFEILYQSLNGQHEIGAPGRHIYTAFLLSDRQEAWEAVEKTLLAAQRQEGTRQVILETIDLTHPVAFRRMVRLILEHDLYRFSSTVRAIDVWFGQLWAAASGGVVKKMLGQVVEFLDDPATREKALRGSDPEAAYLALWCAATEDAVASIPLAEKLLTAKSIELRYVAASHLVNLNLNIASAALIPSLDDEDLRVAILAIPQGHYMAQFEELPGTRTDDRFERLERLVDRVPSKPQKLKALVWPWNELTVKQSQVASCLLFTLGDRSATRLIPHLKKLEPGVRGHAVSKLVVAKIWDDATRQAVIDLAGDASADVRSVALEALLERKLAQAEIKQLEGYLTRTSSDLRRGVLALLLKQGNQAALESGRRLLAAKNANQRLAGLELIRLMTDQKRSVPECREVAEAYKGERKKVSKQEQAHLIEIAVEKSAAPTLEDALGLMNPGDRTTVAQPKNRKVKFITPAAIECLRSLDDLVHEHREASIQYKTYSGTQEELLGNIHWGFPSPDYREKREGQEQNLPLADVWKNWYSKRRKPLQDNDGLELVRSSIWIEFCNEWSAKEWQEWAKGSSARQEVAKRLSGGQSPCTLRYPRLVHEIVEWLLFLYPCDARDYLLDAMESAFASVPAEDMAQLKSDESKNRPNVVYGRSEECDWRFDKAFNMWSEALERTSRITGFEPAMGHRVRQWRLMHWRDRPFEGARRLRSDTRLLQIAYREGAANLADVADHLLGPRGTGLYRGETFSLLEEITARKPEKESDAWLRETPEVKALLDRAIARIVELELSRGDAPTAATVPAHSLGALKGIETLRRILHALGKDHFKLGHSWRWGQVEDRRQTLTQLAKISYPTDDENFDDFTSLMKMSLREGQFSEERLLQLTFLAPQWTTFVEAYLKWPNMREGVYWFLAHMSYIGGLGEAAAEAVVGGQSDGELDGRNGDDCGESADDTDGDEIPQRKKLSAWERLILERTPLSNEDRSQGAIDVPWFQRTYALLKDKRWQQLAAAARFAASPAQAKRAAYVADVLLNRVSRQELVDGIKKRQLKENVRLLGLLPLAKGKKRDADLWERCRILQDYRRYANQLSGLTKPGAFRAWEIGMRNLAQTAGYMDPLRLEWAVGAEAVKDLAAGPVVVKKDEVVVSLSLDDLSKPIVTVQKGEKLLKSIPPAIRKDKKVAELSGRVSDLRRQASSIRQSLEVAMCRGDQFLGDELRNWCGHALLSPLLTRLVVVGEGILGYPDKGGKALRDYDSKLEPVKPKEKLRLAHAHDLLETGEWEKWQRECFQAERVQPFKQVFRELYVLTKQERKDGGVSHRYDGQQVQPKQALALFGQRGWNTQEGIFKVFHDLELTANVDFDIGFTTPLEVENATLAGVSFAKRDQWKPIQLAEVLPRLFSEVMRDIDLVVSISHAGGVDPEASASTVEMRARLLRETCKLLSLTNVRFKPSHALVDGQLANYSVHLGSGTVQKIPGGALCVVPVHSQHRGRLFLPFADDDPRTAEVVSKVLLLARDQEIQDPTILEQIHR